LTVLHITMPYYGDVAYLQLAVRSVLDQADDRWRLTVVDDGKAEGVPEWFESLAHPQVRYLRNEHNLGVTGNFQRCIDLAVEAGAEFMVIMGCDDVMLPNYVGAVMGLIERHPNGTIFQQGVEVIDGAGARTRTLVDVAKKRLYAPRIDGTLVMSGEDLAISLLRGDWLYFPSLCWRTSAISAIGFDTRLNVIQDLDVILRMVERGAELVVGTEVCFQYRRHAVSKSSADAANGSRFVEAREFFFGVADRLEARGWPRAAGVARRHLSSRLHALTMLPTAALNGNLAGARSLANYTFRSTRSTSG
jgi:glycosyltransferase involved in cell wall biosynthesis